MQNETDPRYLNGPVSGGGVPFLSTQANSLSNTVTNALNTAGLDTVVASTPSDATRLSTAISNYTFLSQKLNVSGTANAIIISANTIVVPGNSYGQPFRLPSVMATGMAFQFYTAFANTTSVTLAITGLQTALPLMKTVYSGSTISYSALSSGDISAGQYLEVVYNATANSGSPAFTIAPDLLMSSQSSAGLIQLATTLEVQTGTNNTKAITSSALAGAMINSKLDNGYTYLPNGIIFQWGSSSVITHGSFVVITFPIAFPNALFNWQLSWNGVPSPNNGILAPQSNAQSLSGLQLNNADSDSDCGMLWFAIGY